MNCDLFEITLEKLQNFARFSKRLIFFELENQMRKSGIIRVMPVLRRTK